MVSGIGKSLWVACAAAAFGVGCAAHTPEQGKADDMQRTIASLRAQNAAYLREIEELENQVFILSDRAESEQVNAQRAAQPELPRVKLHPGQADFAVEPASAEGHYASAVPGQEDGTEVEYVGEAARSTGSRPVLRLVGDDGGISVRDEPTREPARVAMVGERAGTAPSRGSLAPARRAVPATDTRGRNAPLELYRAALAQLTGGQHADAAAGFRDFLRRFPDHDYADNAQYWLGECYYDLKDYPTAVREFRRVVEGYPNGNKVPDALLKAGFAYQAMGQPGPSRETLQELRRSYPTHPAAVLAGDKLAELGGTANAGGERP